MQTSLKNCANLVPFVFKDFQISVKVVPKLTQAVGMSDQLSAWVEGKYLNYDFEKLSVEEREILMYLLISLYLGFPISGYYAECSV